MTDAVNVCMCIQVTDIVFVDLSHSVYRMIEVV